MGVEMDSTYLGEKPKDLLGLLSHSRSQTIFSTLGVQEPILQIQYTCLIHTPRSPIRIAQAFEHSGLEREQIWQRRGVFECF